MYRMGKEEVAEIAKVIETKSLFKINDGLRETLKVEEKLKEIFGVKYPIFMTSGHAALLSALVAMGIGPGDQVIVPGYTYIATAMAVVAAGAIPVIAEINGSLTLDPDDFEAKITEHTKAVIPVHIQGFPCDMERITKIAKKHGIAVLEDACQADGGSFRGKRLGTWGKAGALSFNFYKIVSSGEGGALLTSDRKIYERALIYHDSSAIAFFGDQMKDFETAAFCGNEFRSNEFCAAVMNIQLSRLEGILTDLRKNKKYMMEKLKDVCEFIPLNDIEGDCGTTLPIVFKSEKKARAFAEAEGINGTLPIDTGKHVYSNWEPILKKRGAVNKLMDPFKMEANLGIIPAYKKNMCPKTLSYLSKVVYVAVDPDDGKGKLDKKIAQIKKAVSSL